MKRTYSQATTQESQSQSYGSKRGRRAAKSYTRAVSRVPRAIATRGTPAGYYEIPVNVFRRVYWNMSTGLWPTNQTTGASTGLTGYNGFSLGTTLDTSYMSLGNGAFSADNNIAIPGFTEIQTVFDQGKIVRVDYEFYFTNQSTVAASAGAYENPELWIVFDPDNLDPPSTITDVSQYQRVLKVKGNANNGVFKTTVYPKVRVQIGSSSDEAGTTTTLAGTENAGYMDLAKPGAMHFGLRGYFINNSVMTNHLGYLHICERQIRRFKISR